MKRREFITLIGGAAAAWPLAARAQQAERVRRVGVLMLTSSDEPESQTNIAAFLQGLQEAGWAVGRNLRIDYRWSGNDRTRLNQHATELISLGPDVVLAGTGGTTPVLRRVSSTVPIVFAQNIDPVGSGAVASLSRPGTNATGFTQFEYTLSAKWLELLREIAPGLTRAAVVRDAEGSAGIGQWAVIQAAAGPLGVELTPIDPRDIREMQRAVSALRANRQQRLDRGSQLGGVEPPRADRRARDAPQAACRLSLPSLCCEWRPGLLWSGFDQPLPARGGLRRPHPQG